jgi:hypothetical protein
VGPTFSGRPRPVGWGRLLVRTDGVGIIDVHASIDTDDGALVAVTYYGRLDLGEDGYQKYLQSGLAGFLPGEIQLRMVLHFHTTHPNYLWLNRVQGLGNRSDRASTPCGHLRRVRRAVEERE